MTDIKEIKEELSLICDTALERFLVLDNANLKEKLSTKEASIEVLTNEYKELEEKFKDLKNRYAENVKVFDNTLGELMSLRNAFIKICTGASIVTDFVMLNTIDIVDRTSLEIVKVIDELTGSKLTEKAIDVLAENNIKITKGEKDNG